MTEMAQRNLKRPSKGLPASDVEAIFGAFAAANPEPKGELDYINPFTLLVAVVLSAQATDVGVNKATPALFALADTPEKMVRLGVSGIEEKIRTIGLYRGKAKNVFALSQILVEKFDSEVPADREALESLPGVGRKTAMWCSTSPSGSRRSRWIRTCSGSRTAPVWRRAGRRSKWNRGC